MRIIHYGYWNKKVIAVVESFPLRSKEKVIEFVQNSKAGTWTMPAVWSTLVNGKTIVKGNPHLNDRMAWVYLLYKNQTPIKPILDTKKEGW